ncbi:hypothetical protein CYMTET_20143 [Cymbomonas tetramitiformis]|uniref:Mitochondrial substrate carrier family protein n=1 Tax=Cymbomonas tetramitiformis TaxID=36881 RepID=A0AAE0G4S1_9CHLO|nr:hypothetical protein CYMTET_20143 [Cymbomonas tetramitiformis]
MADQSPIKIASPSPHAENADKKPLSHLTQAFCGAIAGAASRTIVAPLDVVKIRLQVQIEAVSGAAKYRTLGQSLTCILKEEGLVGLWRGTVPAVLFWMPYTAVQFAVLDGFKSWAKQGEVFKEKPALISFVGGAVAGVAATLSSYPLDVVRTTLAAQGEPRVYHSVTGAIVGIYQSRGVAGLYAGVTPTLMEIIPHSAVQFGTYDLLKSGIQASHRTIFKEDEAVYEVTPAEKFVCGLISGAIAKSLIHPLDVVKKRMQIAGLKRNPLYGIAIQPNTYKGIFDCLQKILEREGAKGLFKGITPALVKAAPASGITLVLYELFVNFAESFPDR